MALVQKSVLIGYSADRMFDLVDDVERYPEFLPWCPRAESQLREQALDDGETHTRATVFIRYRGIDQHFTTDNDARRGEYIRMKFREGPFRKLDGVWTFQKLRDDACKVSFQLEYEFSSIVLDKLVGPVFAHIVGTFIDSFVRRADQLYGASK